MYKIYDKAFQMQLKVCNEHIDRFIKKKRVHNTH